ncbi:MAG: transcription termination factor Rho [Verrucomicrobiales bacterium]|nr:transcription termination factor Rho [Verrucomicrobiales bacterium]
MSQSETTEGAQANPESHAEDSEESSATVENSTEPKKNDEADMKDESPLVADSDRSPESQPEQEDCDLRNKAETVPEEGYTNETDKRGESRPKRKRTGDRRRRSRNRKGDRSDIGDKQGNAEQNTESAGAEDSETSEDVDGKPRKSRKQRYQERKEKERAREAAALEAAPAIESEGIVEISPKGFGFLREKIRNFQQSPKDVFITPEVVRIFGLRDGLMVKCVSKQGLRGPQLIELLEINGHPPGDYQNLPYFEELTAINPDKKLTLETAATRTTTRVIDLITPIGRGQRGLIVAPPRTGKTTLLHHIAEGIIENYDEEIHLMVLLVDERPEEVTDFQRSFPDLEVFSSSNDSDGKDHTRIALLAIERAKRLVEAGEHVFILMDSITRLARAFNSQMRGGKRGTASGGLVVGALEVPRRIFAAARNTREAGSLTIVATALIQTNSKADEAIFQEFKGTGNMELVLDRQIAQNYVYPAVDIHKSGTRREELLLPPHVLEKIYVIRRGLGGYKQIDAMEWVLRCMERYPSNAQMLMDIKTTALS